MRSADDLRGVTKFSIGLLCAAAFVLIILVLSGSEVDDDSAKAIGTAAALAFLSLTAVAGSHLALRQPQLSLLGHGTALISAIAFLVTTAAIWSGGDDNWKPAIYTLILAFACGHSSVLLANLDERDSDGVRLVRGGTLLGLWLLVGLAIGEIASPGRDVVGARALGVVAILYALGAVVLPLLRRADSHSQPRPDRQGELQIDHVVARAGDPERSARFYGEGLGAGVKPGPEGKVCFVWPGTAESAVTHLRARGIEIVEGPVVRTGTHGEGVSVCCRDPDGNLVELISYP
ncbi:MAG TPA: VOC family protein [Solirubrobacterales bacterium]|nr:VOC family protein [Solirubrobacterales bacterium]